MEIETPMDETEYNFADPDVIIHTPPRDETATSAPPPQPTRPNSVEVIQPTKKGKNSKKTDFRNQKTLLSYAKPGKMEIPEESSIFDDVDLDDFIDKSEESKEGSKDASPPEEKKETSKKLVRRLISETDDEETTEKTNGMGDDDDEELIDQSDGLDLDEESEEDDRHANPFISSAAKESGDESTDEEVSIPVPREKKIKKRKPPPKPQKSVSKDKPNPTKISSHTTRKYDAFMQISIILHIPDKNGRMVQTETLYSEWKYKLNTYPDRSEFMKNCKEEVKKLTKDNPKSICRFKDYIEKIRPTGPIQQMSSDDDK